MYKIFCAVFRISKLVRDDGLLSIKKGFQPDELSRLAKRAGFTDVTSQTVIPARVVIAAISVVMALWLRYFRFDKHFSRFERLLPAEITHLDRDHVRNAFLHDVDLNATGHRLISTVVVISPGIFGSSNLSV